MHLLFLEQKRGHQSLHVYIILIHMCNMANAILFALNLLSLEQKISQINEAKAKYTVMYKVLPRHAYYATASEDH